MGRRKKEKLSKEEEKALKFERKIEKRRQRLKKKYKKAENKNIVTNYTIIRKRSSTYVPLNKLGFFGKISNTVRYLVDMKYRSERLLRERQKQEEEILLQKVRLKKFILTSLEKVPHNAKEITLQIDHTFTNVLESVLNTTVELNSYDYEEIKINRNYLKYIKKPHKLIRFVPNYNI